MTIGDGHDIPFEVQCGIHGEKRPELDLTFTSDMASEANTLLKAIFPNDKVIRAGVINEKTKRLHRHPTAWFIIPHECADSVPMERIGEHEVAAEDVNRLAETYFKQVICDYPALDELHTLAMNAGIALNSILSINVAKALSSRC